ncbi:ComEA family DNA-binding protein [Paenibacillus apiarius]|uniref:ComEA family DNA-binding protein n=1 Tax=Paenibacillus apiarius TaxID=46240 RepID=UPI00197F41A2|nr:ComEA family DNA-binding protein [Paenibacillus apiarius]MBN3525859.1 ComEA family DNA-binding protein [Paenibacillus apiarius]
MKDFKMLCSSFLSRWFMGTGIAIIGLAVCMCLWLRPQWEQETGIWQPVNDEIAQLLGPSQETEPNEADKSVPVRTKAGKEGPDEPSSSPQSAKPELNASARSADPAASSSPRAIHSTQQTDARSSELTDSHRAGSGNLININQADANLLTELPGIGPSKAKAIIAYREQHGPFNKVSDVTKVKGIGPKMFAKLRGKISVE